MSFSASTCLTNIGTTPLGPTLKIYSNPISPTSPGTFVLDVPTDDVTGGNCPYVYELPDGTTSIRLSDPVSGCYCDIPITNVDNICITCDLNFVSYEPTTIGKIVAGNISGSCDNDITDYLVYWYETSDPDTIVFTSGKGNDFLPYLYSHPLEGPTAIPATSGTYSAVLQKIKLNDVVYSKTGGEGTVIADMSCLPSIENGNPILVEALTCINGDSSDLPQYEHKFNYQATTAGVLPEPLSTTFALNSSQNYFVWKFRGFDVPDKIKMTLVGSAYPDPILLEYWEVGNIGAEDYSPTAFPKSANTTTFFGKATCLTGLTINAGDEILIEVIPSITNPQTSWTFYCGCLDTFDCSICQTQFSAPTAFGGTSYQYPIKQSTIIVNSGECTTTVSFSVSADCQYNDIINSDYYKYAGSAYDYKLNENPITKLISNDLVELYYNKATCTQNNLNNPYSDGPEGCISLGSFDIKYEKSVGLFKITSSNPLPISKYYQSYLGISTFISPFSGDNTNIDYYRYFYLRYMGSTGGIGCGDGAIVKGIYLAQQSVVTTGQTGSDYYISFTMPTQTYNMSFDSCSNCPTMPYTVNDYRSNPSYNFTGTTNVGLIYNNPIPYMWDWYTTTVSQTGYQHFGYRAISSFQIETYPSSASTPTSYVNIPAYSAITCPNINDYWYDEYAFSSTYISYSFYYSYELSNPTNNRGDIKIYANEINRDGHVIIGVKTLVYNYSGGTAVYTNSAYLV